MDIFVTIDDNKIYYFSMLENNNETNLKEKRQINPFRLTRTYFPCTRSVRLGYPKWTGQNKKADTPEKGSYKDGAHRSTRRKK